MKNLTHDAPAILDVTLRDGSYAIDFAFTAEDTATFCRELEDVGLQLIEVGHGVGLGATRTGMGKAAATDVEYMQAAARTLTTAKWGMFCIPGIARLEDLDIAADNGMDFVRIGTNVTEVGASGPFIERAKGHGMFVCANFMKSYAMKPRQFAETARTSRSYGSDLVYIVDSAGGMMRQDLASYFQAVRDICDVKLGFHAHNNLQLAIANTLEAFANGAVLADASFQGMGRSAGNAATEILLAAMERNGIETGIDIIRALDFGEKHVAPLMHNGRLDAIDIIAGFAQFHSSYMKVIREFAGKYRIDPRKLIVRLCEHDKVNAPSDLVERLARELSDEDPTPFAERYDLMHYHGSEQLDPPKGS